MFSKRIVLAMLGAALILAAGAVPVSAAAAGSRRARCRATPLRRGTGGVGPQGRRRHGTTSPRPEARAVGRVTLACATPDGEPPSTADAERHDLSALGGAGTAADCDVPSDFLGVSARDQTRGHYCGPAVGQVIANYTWAVPLNANKYTQAQIAVWMRTDELGGTSAFTMADGLDIATARAPRRPAELGLGRHDPRGHRPRRNVRRPASRLRPREHQRHADGAGHPGAATREGRPLPPEQLAGPVNSPGHWIAAYGWRGLYDGTDYSRMYYTDSSEDEGGSTGRFWDPMRHIGGMIRDHTQRFVW